MAAPDGGFPDPVNGPARTTVLVVQSPLLFRCYALTFAEFPRVGESTDGGRTTVCAWRQP